MTLLKTKLLKAGLFLPLVFSILSGCEKEIEEGLQTNADQSKGNSLFTDTLTVKSTVVLDRNLITKNQNLFLAGAYGDPVLGNVSATGYTELSLSEENFDFGSNPQLDSAVLHLNYDNYVYGDSSQAQTLQVYEIEEPIKDDKEYYSYSSVSTYGTLLGSKQFSIASKSSNTISINISDNFANGNILDLASNTQEDFRSNMNGLAIVPKNNNEGAVTGLIFNEENGTRLTLYYNDSLSFHLYPGSGAQHFYHIESDRSGTDVAPLDTTYDTVSTSAQHSPNTSNRGIIQDGIGIKTKLTFPYLQSLRKKYGDIAVNKAELIINPVSNTADQFPPPELLYMYQTNGNNVKLTDDNGNVLAIQSKLESGSGTATPVVEEFNEAEGNYTLPLTTHFQEMLYGDKPNKGIMLAPLSSSTKVNRLIFGNHQHQKNRLKIKIYFSNLE